MPAVQPTTLVVYVNFAVGSAIAQRLMEAGVVAIAPAAAAPRELARPGGYDVVVLCPYLGEQERDLLLGACAAMRPRPSVLELADRAERGGARVAALALPEHGRSAAGVVLDALGLPTTLPPFETWAGPDARHPAPRRERELAGRGEDRTARS